MSAGARLLSMAVAGGLAGALCGVAAPGATAAAGAVIGLALSLAGLAGGQRLKWRVAGALLIANPIAIVAYGAGPATALLLAAATMIACAAITFAATRDYRACVVLGLVLALAPLVSKTALFFYPALFVALPLMSPWGLGLRRMAGFAVIVWSPLAMGLAGLAYLHWLFAAAGAAPTPAPLSWRAAIAPETLVMVAGAGVMALAATIGSRLAAVLAFVATAGLAALVHPEWLAGF